MASLTTMEGMLVRIASVGRERLSCGGDGKSLVRAIGLQEIEFAGVLGSLRGLWGGIGMVAMG